MSFGERAIVACRGDWLDPDPETLEREVSNLAIMQRERIPSSDAAISMFEKAASTLTSINLDWVYCAPARSAARNPTGHESWPMVYQKLFSCRFPHLRSFQWRNCVVAETKMPDGLYLLDSSNIATSSNASRSASSAVGDLAGLEFMEAHPGLHCLAWPVDHFYSHAPSPPDVAERAQAVVDNLGRVLVDLRVDTLYSGTGERNSEYLHCRDTGLWYTLVSDERL